MLKKYFYLMLLVTLFYTGHVMGQEGKGALYSGTWKAFSKACIRGSTLTISDNTLTWHYDTAREKARYMLFETDNTFPPSGNSGVPESHARYTLRLLDDSKQQETLNLMSFAVYYDRSEFSMFKPDQELLSVWQHSYKSMKDYQAHKKDNNSALSWCLYTR